MVRIKYSPTRDNTHLRDLYLAWKEDPATHEEELMAVLDKIILSTLYKSGKRGWNRSFEDEEDLLPTYRAFCRPLLDRIKPNSSNKEIFAYIRSSVYWYNKRRKKASTSRNLQEIQQVEKQMKSLKRDIASNAWDQVVHFEAEDQNRVAQCLIQGYSVIETCEILGWEKDKVNMIINELKEHYKELGYGSY